MLVFVVLLVCLAAKAEEFNPLGRAIYLPNYNVMGKLEETGTEVLLSNYSRICSISTKEPISKEGFTFYNSTKSFYSNIATSAGLSASMQADFTLGFTLDTTTKSIAGSKRTVSGMSMLIMAQTYQTRINNNCLLDPKKLAPGFLADFKKLPVVIGQPWLSGAWQAYNAFLSKYGTHVVTSITYGSSINQMAYADSSDSYNERDFQVDSCLKLSGGSTVSGIESMGVDTCTGVNKTEIDRVTSMKMSDDLVIRGGSPDTRNQLIINRTSELITKFLNEAHLMNSTIDHAFVSVWDLLRHLYAGVDNANFIRAVNMQYFYLGYLNYGCPFSEHAGQQLQMFNFTKYHTPDSPQYECSLAAIGCHSDNDCHYKPIWCSCRGDSCITHIKIVQDTGTTKLVAQPNVNSDWGWHNCYWKRGHAGSVCVCRWPSDTRSVVWSLENKSVTYLLIDRQRKTAQHTDQETKQHTDQETKQEL